MSKEQQLDRIEADILNNNVCPDLADSATQLVMGEGNPDADIVLIGEAPGRQEDEQGRPFIGASGKFLDKMLSEAQLVRSDVYITNIVKYRPPSNRDPLPSEKDDFWPYLMRQLDVINPKVIVTLGRHSMEYFLPGVKISESHGVPRMITLSGRSVTMVPLYHPAAALYNGSMRQVLVDDFMKITQLISRQ